MKKTAKKSAGHRTFPKIIRDGAVSVRIYKTKSDRMASGWLYQVAWHDGEARRIKQFAEYAKAEDEARLRAAQLRAGRAGDQLVSASDLDELTTIRREAGKGSAIEIIRAWNRAAAVCQGNVMEAAQLWQATHAGKFQQITLDDAIREFLAAKTSAGVNVMATYKNRLRDLQAAFPGAILSKITGKQLNDFLRKIAHPVTRNTARKNYVTLWSWCRNQGYLPDSIRTAAERTDRAAEGATSIEIYKPDEAKAVLRFIAKEHPHYLAPVVLGMFCGLRCKEIHLQQWDDVHLDKGALYVTSAKANTPAHRYVEISPVAMEWILRCPGRTGRVCGNQAIDRVRDICRGATLPTPLNGLRHSFISYMMASGRTAGEVAMQAGTSETQIHKHYRKPALEADAQAFFALTPGKVLKADNKVVQMKEAK